MPSLQGPPVNPIYRRTSTTSTLSHPPILSIQTTLPTMFGPFRLTNPLSGGLLWYHTPLITSLPPIPANLEL